MHDCRVVRKQKITKLTLPCGVYSGYISFSQDNDLLFLLCEVPAGGKMRYFFVPKTLIEYRFYNLDEFSFLDIEYSL